MQLGFLTAILGDLSFEDVLKFAADEGFAYIEPMCWPVGKAERRYAGVTHIDVTSFNDEQAGKVKDLLKKHGIALSALGYYPNPLNPDAEQRKKEVEHLKKVITAAPMLGLDVVTTFMGRDHTKTVEDNWPMVQSIWPDIVKHAEANKVRIALENCPMIFSNDEWPGGKNLATTPALWRKLFDELGPNVGLNFDPSHLVWQHIDYVRCVRDFGQRIFHFHAKDTRIDPDMLYAVGIMGLKWHTPKIPGFGDVDWGKLISTLTDSGYKGPVIIEVEDRSFEDSFADRRRALRQSKKYLEQFTS